MRARRGRGRRSAAASPGSRWRLGASLALAAGALLAGVTLVPAARRARRAMAADAADRAARAARGRLDPGAHVAPGRRRCPGSTGGGRVRLRVVALLLAMAAFAMALAGPPRAHAGTYEVLACDAMPNHGFDAWQRERPTVNGTMLVY